MFDKSKINFVIDALMFLCTMAITGIGFLIKFVLIPGKERWVECDRNVALSLLGMDRHEWGEIHLVLGLILFGLLVLHIILHWKMILCLYRKLIGNQSARRIIALVFMITCLIALIFPFIVNPKAQELGQGEGRRRAAQSYGEERKKEHREAEAERELKRIYR